MVSMSGLHALSAELHAGMLTLAFACIMIVVASQIVVRLRKRMPKRFVGWAITARGYAEPAGYVAAILGVLALVLSAWTGMYAWPMDKLMELDLVKNKILLTAYSTILWSGVIFIRTRFGRALWTCPYMVWVYVGLAAIAFGMIAVAGCMGSLITRGESLLEPVYEFVGIDIEKAFEMTPDLAAGITLASMLIVIVSMIVARWKNLFDVVLAPETCQKIFNWDEPKLY
ncbi:MAG: hypothetical protein A3K60_04310 [Euryarchaeota archaeon RBG_19FT_COMBO_56_21]|nr:MAG: hypothetical protein A3K60_04310 [Euryarchaeota archaeon RBG_19FT_COMBO_56_21]